jgi:hypothetical protein
MKNKIWEVKTIKVNNAYYHLCRDSKNGDWKLHKWDGPAIEPLKGSSEKKKYYLYGIEYTKDEFDSAVRDREGIPFHKTAVGIKSMRNGV